MNMSKQVAEGKRRAAEARAKLTPEQLALADSMPERLLHRLVRMFTGTEDMARSKGHQPCLILGVEEFKQFRLENPAEHRWAEWEKSLAL